MKRGPFALAFAGLLALPAAALALSDVIYSSGGEGVDDQYGYVVAAAGDVNADGTPDYLVGAPFYDAVSGEATIQNVGKAYVHSGATGEIIRSFVGEGPGHRLGSAVASLGDVNGDGAAEIVVGAPLFTGGGLVQRGKVYVFSGMDAQLLYEAVGERQGDQFGFAVAAAGDVNGDLVPDFLVGAPEYDGAGGLSTGRVYVFSGADGAPLGGADGESSNGRFGASAADAGDIDGDGTADFIVGAPDRNAGLGSAYVLSGTDASLIRRLDGTPDGELNAERFGASVDGGGDMDGDGRADVVVAAPGRAWLCNDGKTTELFPEVGRVYWYSGAEIASAFPTITELDSEDAQTFIPCTARGGYQARFGAALRVVRDFDLDGRPDVLVGSPGADTANGKMFLYSGANRKIILEFYGGVADRLGYGAAADEISDVSGDGVPDLIVGAYQHQSGKSDSGRVYVLSGAQTNLISNTSRFKPDQFAAAVVGLDDLNEDGRADYCGGAPYWEVDYFTRPSDNTGIVECYNGPPAETTGLVSDEIIEFEGPLETVGTPPLEKGQVFGSAVAAIRNNEDGGLTEVIVGAPLRDVFKMVDGMLVKLQNAGEAFRLSALDGSVIAEYKGVEVGNRFGAAVANAGDVNGDGFEDVIVGAPDSATLAGAKAGRAYVFSGATHLLLNQYEGENAQDAFGSAVASAGDVNGDGRDDLLVGAPQVDGPAGTNAGRVYVFAGGSASTSPILVIDGPQRNQFFGSALARLADLDGNGFDDYAVGSPSFDIAGATDAGAVTVFDGAFGAELFSVFGSAKQDFFGASLAPAADVDGDGLPELLVGAPGVANLVGWKTGKVFVYSSEPAEGGGIAPKLLLDYAGQANGDAFGNSVSGGGDMDGDGVPDIVVGAYLNVGTAGASTGQYGRAYAFNVVCRDQDEDGYGSPPTPLCDFPTLDCKDLDPDVNPGREEVQFNGKDDDCDPRTRDACDGSVLRLVLLGAVDPPEIETVGSLVRCLRAGAGLG